ncbi:hypothetical protein ABTX71_12995 [Streptomyces parvulus]|uniref:hypothetical protein n=1 Tax=Streptomyces parvulus TaxID=146923 RepID=UPI003319183D
MTERFRYSGTATVDGVHLPNVRLQENPPEGEMRSWEGSASFPAADAPEGFPANLDLGSTATVELPDGRKGQALITNTAFDGHRWTVELTGTGPAPA